MPDYFKFKSVLQFNVLPSLAGHGVGTSERLAEGREDKWQGVWQGQLKLMVLLKNIPLCQAAAWYLRQNVFWAGLTQCAACLLPLTGTFLSVAFRRGSSG